MTLGTRLYTWLRGEQVGADSAGNRYYRDKTGASRGDGLREKRWVMYNGDAEASRVQITLEALDGRLQMRVEDNGRGFDPAQTMGDGDGHYGLRTMHERAEQLGGQLSVRSAPGAGTRVIADLPMGGHPREERQ